MSMRAAVVGTGFIGPVHVEALRRVGVEVVGILGSSLEKSEQAARSLGLAKGYAGFSDLLRDDSVTAVHLASPNRLHFEQCQQVLAAGKHVVCEKPLAMNTTETQNLVRLAAEHPNLVTAVNYNVRFYPLVLEARSWLRSGTIGEVFHITGSYFQDWLLEPTDFNWRVDSREGGALRAVADIGTHWLDTLLFITGLEVSEVLADLSTVHPIRHKPTGGSETFTGSTNTTRATIPVKIDTEDYGSILLRFSNGAKGVVSVSQVLAGCKNSIRYDLAGSLASLSWDSEEPNTLSLGTRPAVTRITRDPGSMSQDAKRHSDYPAGHAEGFPDTFKQLYRAIYQDIAAGQPSASPLYATFADGHREVQLCEAILQSHRENRWVKL
ncbi:MAG: Gfo/Idh/MocA family protein [Fimbriiglobus sp.]